LVSRTGTLEANAEKEGATLSQLVSLKMDELAQSDTGKAIEFAFTNIEHLDATQVSFVGLCLTVPENVINHITAGANEITVAWMTAEGGSIDSETFTVTDWTGVLKQGTFAAVMITDNGQWATVEMAPEARDVIEQVERDIKINPVHAAKLALANKHLLPVMEIIQDQHGASGTMSQELHRHLLGGRDNAFPLNLAAVCGADQGCIGQLMQLEDRTSWEVSISSDVVFPSTALLAATPNADTWVVVDVHQQQAN
jgi:hypothetical protein